MSISSIGSSNASLYTYQWNNQQLQGSSSNSSSATTAYSYGGTSTVSSMIELATYAMEAMGVSSSERVTFSQIEKYKTQLEEQFSESLNASIQSTNIDEHAHFTVNLDADGEVTVNSTHADKAKIQAYFDIYPEMATNLREELDAAGFEGEVQFSVGATGAISSVISVPKTTTAELEESTLGTNIVDELTTDEEEIEPFSLTFNEGALSLSDEEHEHSEAITQYLNDNPTLSADLKAQLEAANITADEANIRINIDAEGKVSVEYTEENTDADEEQALHDFLVEQNVGNDLKTNFKNLGIDPDIDFRLTVEDGQIIVNSSHPDAAKVQILLNKSEDLVKDYLQIDALAGLDGARKSMQIDSSAMRNLIEMENMSKWWASTGTTNVGSFTGGTLSSYAGVNSIV